MTIDDRRTVGEAVLDSAISDRRRLLLRGGSLLGLGVLGLDGNLLGSVPPAIAQAARRRIDVHHHFIPPFHVEAMTAPGRRVGQAPPKWSPQMSLEEMDKSGIQTSVLSIVQPGVLFGKDFESSRKLARQPLIS